MNIYRTRTENINEQHFYKIIDTSKQIYRSISFTSSGTCIIDTRKSKISNFYINEFWLQLTELEAKAFYLRFSNYREL